MVARPFLKIGGGPIPGDGDRLRLRGLTLRHPNASVFTGRQRGPRRRYCRARPAISLFWVRGVGGPGGPGLGRALVSVPKPPPQSKRGACYFCAKPAFQLSAPKALLSRVARLFQRLLRRGQDC